MTFKQTVKSSDNLTFLIFFVFTLAFSLEVKTRRDEYFRELTCRYGMQQDKNLVLWVYDTAKNPAISPNFLVWKLYLSKNFPHPEIGGNYGIFCSTSTEH